MKQDGGQPDRSRPVALMTTCLANLLRPSVVLSSIAVLEQARCTVLVPHHQVCCGQPAYNLGDVENARKIAKQVIVAFEEMSFVVVPSGSCAGMLRHHYPLLFADDNEWLDRATALSEKIFELSEFLVDKLKYVTPSSPFVGTVTFHDSCSALRELGLKTQPRRLLSAIEGINLVEHDKAEVCCGFGGTFCVKFPDISNAMVCKKVDSLLATGADTVLACDLGCLLQIAGKLRRIKADIEVRHIAEVLVQQDPVPAAIGKED